ncbi:MAG: hypothetical protein KIS92_12045 [Planctomycetota bacterium]|nr:hypothetical protein [Planctomycetota bacterium]
MLLQQYAPQGLVLASTAIVGYALWIVDPNTNNSSRHLPGHNPEMDAFFCHADGTLRPRTKPLFAIILIVVGTYAFVRCF